MTDRHLWRIHKRLSWDLAVIAFHVIIWLICRTWTFFCIFPCKDNIWVYLLIAVCFLKYMCILSPCHFGCILLNILINLVLNDISLKNWECVLLDLKAGSTPLWVFTEKLWLKAKTSHLSVTGHWRVLMKASTVVAFIFMHCYVIKLQSAENQSYFL